MPETTVHERTLPHNLEAERSVLGSILLHTEDRKSTRLNSSHSQISYAVFCLKKKKKYEVQWRLDEGTACPELCYHFRACLPLCAASYSANHDFKHRVDTSLCSGDHVDVIQL